MCHDFLIFAMACIPIMQKEISHADNNLETIKNLLHLTGVKWLNDQVKSGPDSRAL